MAIKKVYENLRLEYKIYITKNSLKKCTELEIVGREWEAEMEKSRIKGQQIKIIEHDGNDRYYTKERKEEDRNREQKHSQGYENNYERQNNFKRELQNTQYRPQFHPRYANNGTRYFYNNQKSQNTYPRTRDNNGFLNRTKFNYNRSFRYPNPNKWFGRKEKQISEDSNRQQIEGIPKWLEPTYNAKDDNQKGKNNRKFELNPSAPEYIVSRKQNEENENSTVQQPIKCYNCGGKGHMRRDCWYSQGNANEGY